MKANSVLDTIGNTPHIRINRLFGSSFHARASDAEWRAGVTLWLKSFHQVPAGSALAVDRDRFPAEVTAVATFYSMLQTKPIGKYHIQVCKTLSCKLLGAEKVAEHCSKKLGIKPGETTPDSESIRASWVPALT